MTYFQNNNQSGLIAAITLNTPVQTETRNITEGDEYPPAGAWQYTYVWEIQGAITCLKIISEQHADNMHN